MYCPISVDETTDLKNWTEKINKINTSLFLQQYFLKKTNIVYAASCEILHHPYKRQNKESNILPNILSMNISNDVGGPL